MAKKKYYFKPLSINNKNQYTSRIITGKYSLVYPPGKWVKPLIGKIFISETRKDALAFSETHMRLLYCVKKCEARGVTKPRGDVGDYLTPKRIRSFWRKIFKNGSLPISKEWPSGTLWAEAIRIIE